MAHCNWAEKDGLPELPRSIYGPGDPGRLSNIRASSAGEAFAVHVSNQRTHTHPRTHLPTPTPHLSHTAPLLLRVLAPNNG